ncbi:MAG: nucleotidyltransferase domain-containing protein [Candidatus Margulisiibacteriota bacterium]
MTSGKLDIRAQDLARVQAILVDHLPPETAVWVFGSRAFGPAKRFSDLDLAIDAGRKLTKQEQMRLGDAFEESDLPYRVDVVDLHAVGDAFRGIIESKRVALVAKAAGRRFSDA